MADSFPCRCRLYVYLLLSSARKGAFPGKVLVVHDNGEVRRILRHAEFAVFFPEDNERIAKSVVIENLVFPHAGEYSFEIWFEARNGVEVMKAEHIFSIAVYEE